LAALRAAARRRSQDTDQVLSRDDLRDLGIDDRMIRREVAAERWLLHGRQTIATHTGPLGETGLRWRAVWEVGARIAAVDGVSALQAAGLTGFQDTSVHVSVKHTASVRAPSGVRVHKVTRRVEDELVPAGLPRTRPPVAAIRASQWAVSNRHSYWSCRSSSDW
jgi:hypothetical protein